MNKKILIGTAVFSVLLLTSFVFADMIVTRPDGCQYRAKQVDGAGEPVLELVKCSGETPQNTETTASAEVVTYEPYVEYVKIRADLYDSLVEQNIEYHNQIYG